MKIFSASKMIKCKVNDKIYGEDGPPVALFNLSNGRFMIGVFDGMGGRGATICKDGKTQAHHAAHAVSEACRHYFKSKQDDLQLRVSKSDLEEEIKKSLQNCSKKHKIESISKLKGSLSSEFPTTAVIAHNFNDSNSIELLWAGDSRVYGIFDNGFFPLTEDHVDDFKIYPVSSSPIKKYLTTDTNSLELKILKQQPIALIVCSDGLFDAYPYPPALADAIIRFFCEDNLQQNFDDYLHKSEIAQFWSDDVSISGILLRDDDQTISELRSRVNVTNSDKLCLNYLTDQKEKVREIEKQNETEKSIELINRYVSRLEDVEKIYKNKILGHAEIKEKKTSKIEEVIKYSREIYTSQINSKVIQDLCNYENINLVNIESSEDQFSDFENLINTIKDKHALSKLNECISKLQDELLQSKYDKEECQKQLEIKKSELEKIEKSGYKMIKAKNSEIIALFEDKDDKGDYEDIFRKLRAHFMKSVEMCDATLSEIDKLKSEIKSIENKISIKDTNISVLRQEIDKKKQDRENKTSELKELKSNFWNVFPIDLLGALLAYVRETKSNKELKMEYDEDIRRLSSEIRELEIEIEKIEKTKKQKSREKTDHEKELDRSKDKINALGNSIEKTAKKLEENTKNYLRILGMETQDK